MSLATTAIKYMTRPAHGALLGAGVGAAGAAMERREDGTRGSLVRGALRGAAMGAAAAGAGGYYRDTRLLNPGAGAVRSVGLAARRAGTGVANFARRQVHGFTGAGNADAIGMAGTATAEKQVDLLRRRFEADARRAGPKTLANLQQGHAAEVEAVRRAGAHAQQMREAGMSNLPGMASAFRDPAKRPALFRAIGRTMVGADGTRSGLALGLGVPVALNAPTLLRGDESATGGATLKQKLVGLGGSMVAGAATAGLPIVPQLITGAAADYGIQKLTQPKKVAP